MGSRRQVPGSYGRSLQAPGMVLHDELPAGRHRIDRLPPPELLDNRLAAQAAEIEQLAEDNRRLTATYVALKQDLSAAQRDVEKLKEHVRSSQTESDIQIRLLLDKIAKIESDPRAPESVKKDVHEAHLEARSLVTANMELTGKIHQAMQELEKARGDVKKQPEMHAELDALRKEHQNLRKTFEYEKGLNKEKVEQMKLAEKEIIGMAHEIERLRAEVLNAEKRAQGFDPYGHPVYPAPPMHVENYQASHIPVMSHIPVTVGSMGEGMYPYGSSSGVGAHGARETPPLLGTHGGATWGGHDASSQARS